MSKSHAPRVETIFPSEFNCPIPRFADELDLPLDDEVPLRIRYER